jgi:hypothetical protein
MRNIRVSGAIVLIAFLASCWIDTPPTGVLFDLVAQAGPDQVVECTGHDGASVSLNGSASETDGQPITHEWRGPFGSVMGPNPTVKLPLGSHQITLIIKNVFGGTSTDIVVVEVVDRSAPQVQSVSVVPPTLWPPNHTMAPVSIAVDVTDTCDAAAACRIVAVTSNEPANDLGDGNTSPDWSITGPLTVELRAERSGLGKGRVYTITVQCSDGSGNAAASRQVVVTVPHDQRS